MKTSELMPPALNWAVAKCEGFDPYTDEETGQSYLMQPETVFWKPSTDWAQGGPIIEREKITVEHSDKYGWIASQKGPCSVGPTPLIAAMRCYVASKMGNTVEVPEELT